MCTMYEFVFLPFTNVQMDVINNSFTWMFVLALKGNASQVIFVTINNGINLHEMKILFV